jgi:hypothetical protein
MSDLNSKGYSFDRDDKNCSKDPVEELKWLLSAEITSLNSFVRCLETPSAASLHAVSAACRDIHTLNVQLLGQRLTDLGAEVQTSADLWHSFLELLNATASVFGEEAILAALRKHEMALLSDYETKIGSFDSENLVLVQGQLIPNQVKVCELLGGIRSDQDASEVMTNTDMPVNLNWA